MILRSVVIIRNMIVHVDAEKASGSDWFPTTPGCWVIVTDFGTTIRTHFRDHRS